MTNLNLDYNKFLLGALLHDIGKIIQRKGREKKSHSDLGFEYLQKTLGKEIAFFAKCHHKKDIKKLSQLLKDNNHLLNAIWLVHIADCISSGERQNITSFNPGNPLLSIFSAVSLSVNKNKKDKYFYPYVSFKNGEILFPERKNENLNIALNYSAYQSAINELSPRFSLDLWLVVLENLLFSVPAMTSSNEVVSLFDHLKMTCALAGCLYKKYEDKIRKMSFKEFSKKVEEEVLNKSQPQFLLIGGDFSGIQRFVFGVTGHHKALLRVKGRSLYLEFLSLDIVREILKRLNLSWANVILNSGGHFYIVAPNLEDTKEELNCILREVNRFLFDNLKGELFLAMSFVEFGAKDVVKSELGELGPSFSATQKRGENIENLFRKLHLSLSEMKSKKFCDILLEDYDNWQEGGALRYKESLCHFCKLNTGEENEEVEGKRECLACKRFRKVAKQFRPENRIFQKIGIWFKKTKTSLSSSDEVFEFPFSYFGLRNIDRINLKTDFAKECLGITLINFYNLLISNFTINLFSLPENIPLGFLNSYFVSWYSTQIAEDLDETAKKSLGIKKIALLKADVDNLGEIFKRGIQYEYRTLSSLATLSRNLDWFFKIYINWLGNINEGLKINIHPQQGKILKEFENSKKWEYNKERNIQILYSGGDDLVVIGPWNEVVDFALDLEFIFKKYVGENPEMHFSSGIVIIDKKVPIYKAIELAEERLKKSKVEDKNRVYIFERQRAVNWDKFRNVLNEFSPFLVKDKNGKFILKDIKKSVIYKILMAKEMIEDKNNNSVNLLPIVYLHYLIARSEKLKESQILKEYLSLERDPHKKNVLVASSKFKYIDIGLVWLDYLTRIR